MAPSICNILAAAQLPKELYPEEEQQQKFHDFLITVIASIYSKMHDVIERAREKSLLVLFMVNPNHKQVVLEERPKNRVVTRHGFFKLHDGKYCMCEDDGTILPDASPLSAFVQNDTFDGHDDISVALTVMITKHGYDHGCFACSLSDTPEEMFGKAGWDIVRAESNGIVVNSAESPLAGLCLCSRCHEMGTRKCGKCRVVYYCSKECQAADWENHKEFCKKHGFSQV